MSNGRIYFYSEGRFLACLSAADGKLQWRNSDANLLEAIGPALPAQSYVNGFSTTAYMKSSDKAIYFAGPQRTRLVAASTADGRLLWQYPARQLPTRAPRRGPLCDGQDRPEQAL